MTKYEAHKKAHTRWRKPGRTVEPTRTVAELALALRGLGTREAALTRRVEIDVAKWGEGEREASYHLHDHLSYGLLINSIAVADVEHLDEELMRLAAVVMTADDRAELRKGG